MDSVNAMIDKLISRLNVTIHVKGRFNRQRPHFVVANHISWLDALILAKQAPFSFVAKQEVKSWPIVGPITEKCHVQFIERQNKFAVYRSLPSLEKALKDNRNVIVFPEGTTTSGKTTEHFYPMLFEAAVRTGVPIQPVAIRYTDEHNKPLPDIAFIDEDVLLDTLKRMFKHPTIHAHIHCLSPFDTLTIDRKQCALQARQQINRVLDTYA